ncbi:MFS transporter [Wenjunlia tyrosinilytica]|uniref:MFS transporter n=1 Tax=Wenjunlia tyrosinilytica TaxID=1544741 RepID=A0A917ZD08_9ACTN|nr:MFS transporter [Wenjunlia tyrosinilytica]GGO80566.1 MFS transporter [Wenjunlia tyrosinilytica]
MDHAPSDPPPRGTRSAAAAAAFALWSTMTGTTIPTPLYPLYERAFDFSSLTVTVVFAVYAIGVVVGLLAFGRLSDQIGRRPVMAIAALLSAFAAGVFLAAQDVTVMLVGRVFSGFAAALITGSATAAITELMPSGGRVGPATVALFANMGGLASGTLLAGILADAAPWPLRTPWVVSLALSLIALAWVLAGRESAEFRSGFELRWQRLRIPQEIRGAFLRSAMAAGAGFAVLGVLTSVTGLFLGTVLHSTSHTLTGAVVFTAFLCTALGQLLVRLFRPSTALTVACAGLIAAAALIATAMAVESLAPLFAGAAVVGLATGMAVGHGVSTIATRVAAERRGEAFSTFFAILYTMLALPAVGVGVLIELTSLRPAGGIFSGLVALLALAVLVSLGRRKRAR